MTAVEIAPVARIRNAYEAKFGVPRQSGLAPAVLSDIVFEEAFRNPDALRGLEGFSHLWLIWGFSQVPESKEISPTVRPPRLGGNTRMGVFATRSPFRPNRLGLSAVKIEQIVWDGPLAPVIRVSGADLMNGTPIYDVKPYLPYADCIPDARGGFADRAAERKLEVLCPEEIWRTVPPELRDALRGTLAQDPRPSYQQDPERVYGMAFGGLNVRFRVEGNAALIVSVELEKQRESEDFTSAFAENPCETDENVIQ